MTTRQTQPRSTDELVTLQWDRRRSFSRIVAGLVRRFDQLLLRPRLAAMGSGSYIMRPRWLHGAAGLALGNDVRIWRHAMIEILRVFPDRPTITIGDGTVIRPYCHIGAVTNIAFGRRVVLSPSVLVTDHEHDFTDPADPIATNNRVLATPVVLEDDVFLGERSAVLRGVRIGQCSIVGANSVVKDSIPPYSIAVGMPARVVRRYDPERRSWIKA